MTRPAFLLCVLLVAGGAAVHGAATRRWAGSDGPPPQSARLHAWTLTLGDFAGEEIPNDLPVKEKSVATSKRYYSPTKQLSAVVTVITGPPGSVATHCPDVCYPASGYRTVREPARETVELPGGGTASYYVAEFEKKTQTRTERQRVRWSWSVGGSWDAPSRPRFAYLASQELAKIYVITAAEAVESASPAEDSQAVKSLVAAAFAQSAAALAGN
jgi:hypothetical protein